MNDPVSWAYRIILLIILAAIAVLAWLHFKPVPQPVGAPTIAKQAPQLAGVQTETIKPPSVVVFKQTAKKKLFLPQPVQDDPHQHVLASSRIPANLHPQTITTTIDDTTGKPSTYVTVEPLPWLAVKYTGSARIDYGYRGADRIWRLSGHQDMIQVKAWAGGISASIDSDGQHFIGLGAGCNWDHSISECWP